jgi:hypothetical protein
MSPMLIVDVEPFRLASYLKDKVNTAAMINSRPLAELILCYNVCISQKLKLYGYV